MNKNTFNNLNTHEYNRQKLDYTVKNGRIDISGPHNNKENLPLFREKPRVLDSINNQNLSHTYDETKEQRFFFSKENIDNLQKLLKYHVWLQSEKTHVISEQNVNELLIIMKSIYLQYGSNSNINVIEQVKKLNAFVLDYCVPNILINIEMSRLYKKNVSKIPKPMELPKYISRAGTRTNPNYFI
uniref:Minor capsid protein P8 central region domain-containing protein n=1 Tax=viral metagenome TaxID=1070528 RepID=A0A6C0JHY8_9ZZZZ